MVDTRTQIEDYLELLHMSYTWNDKEDHYELVFTERKDDKPVAPDDKDTFQYKLFVKPGMKWIQIYTDIYPLKKIPEKKRGDVLMELLQANRKYAEVCFDFEKTNGQIGSSQEMMVQGLNFDSFREEFLAVPWAVKKFWTEIATKFNLD